MDWLGQLIKTALEALFQTVKFPQSWETTKKREEKREEER